MSVILKLPWAPSANQIWRNYRSGQVYLSKKYQVFLERAYYAWLEQGAPRFKSETAKVVLNLFPPSTRPYDVDNRIKPTLDALTKIGFWKDDRIVRKITAIANPPVEGGAIIVDVDASQLEVDDKTSQEIITKNKLVPIKNKVSKNGK